MQYDKIIKKDYGGVSVTYGVKFGGETLVFIKGGRGGHIDGENNYYVKLANIVRDNFGYSVLAADNPIDEYRENPLTDDFAFINTLFNKPDVIYVGNSAGANYGSWYGYLYPQIKHILLINPLLFMNPHKASRSAENFEGRIKYVIGEQDESAKWVAFVPKSDNVCHELLKDVGHCLPDETFMATVTEFLKDVQG